MRMIRTISARSGRRRGVAGRAARGGFLAALSLGLGACGFGGSHAAAPVPAVPKSHPLPKADPAAKALAGMVDAVGPSRSHPPVDLKFAIRDRPAVGQDDVIDIALIAQRAGVQSLHVAFVSNSGLKLVTDGALRADKPLPGAPVFGSVTVRPPAAGLYTLTATVTVQSPDQTLVWPFSIPLIAGQGSTPTAANPP
jgi:hypothetical protein